MTRIPKPIARFRVYPNPPTKWRYEVCVFATQAEMYEYGRRRWKQTTENYYALCLSMATAEIRGRKLGEILFSIGTLTDSFIVHEAVHAAHHWMATRCGRDAVIVNSEGSGHETEEWTATAAASVASQILAEAQRLCDPGGDDV